MKDTARSSGFFCVKTQLGVKMIETNLFVCATCFGLTSRGAGMQSCLCEENKSYPGIDCPGGLVLCYMCATCKTGGTSRWSWNACESCLKFNRFLARKYRFSLPLGRHSIMNSISVPLKASQEIQEKAIETMLQFITTSGSLSDWGKLQARVLFEEVHSWRHLEFVPLETWQAKFHLSKVKATSRSAQAFKDYLRINEFEEMVP